MEIKPKIGIDNLKFGMYRKDILEILGTPDLIWTNKDNEDEQKLVWNNLKLRLTFQLNENDRLTYIMSKNPNLSFAGQQVIGIDIEQAKNKVFLDLTTQWEIEDYESFQTHFDESNWLILHSEFDAVNEIELGVPFANENDYDWPN